MADPRLHWNGRELYVGQIYVGRIMSLRPWSSQWRAWLQTDEDGEEIGRYDVPAIAMIELHEAAAAALDSRMKQREMARVEAHRDAAGDDRG